MLRRSTTSDDYADRRRSGRRVARRIASYPLVALTSHVHTRGRRATGYKEPTPSWEGRIGRAEEGERTKTSSRSDRTRRYHRVIAITLTVGPVPEIDRRERLRREPRDHSATAAGGFASVARTCDQLYTRRLHTRWACGRAASLWRTLLSARSVRRAPGAPLCLPARTGRQKISINSSMVIVGRETPVPLPAILHSLHPQPRACAPTVRTMRFEYFFPAFPECFYAPLIPEGVGKSCIGLGPRYCCGDLGERCISLFGTLVLAVAPRRRGYSSV